jgi:hypothetical protein
MIIANEREIESIYLRNSGAVAASLMKGLDDKPILNRNIQFTDVATFTTHLTVSFRQSIFILNSINGPDC